MIDFVAEKSIEEQLLNVDELVCHLPSSFEQTFVRHTEHLDAQLLFHRHVNRVAFEQIVDFLCSNVEMAYARDRTYF